MNEYYFLKTIFKDITTLKRLMITAKIASTSITNFMITILFFSKYENTTALGDG